MSSSEVAELANTSQPSVTRFAVALGYEGYPDLKRTIRAVCFGEGPETPEEARANELQQAVTAEINNLQRLGETLADLRPIEEASRVLATSRPLVIVGLRASAPLAQYFGFFAAKVHLDVRVLQEGGSILYDQLAQARSAGADALLVFLMPRYPKETIEVLRWARQAGFRVVTLSDQAFAPVNEFSDVVLHAAVGSQLVFDSQAAPMVLSTVLLQAICDALPAQSQNLLEAFEQSAAMRKVFMP